MSCSHMDTRSFRKRPQYTRKGLLSHMTLVCFESLSTTILERKKNRSWNMQHPQADPWNFVSVLVPMRSEEWEESLKYFLIQLLRTQMNYSDDVVREICKWIHDQRRIPSEELNHWTISLGIYCSAQNTLPSESSLISTLIKVVYSTISSSLH